MTVRPLFATALLLSAAAALAQSRTNLDQSNYTELHDPPFPIKSGLKIVPAAGAGLRDDDLVIGIVVAGEARAYPVNLMWDPPNESLNDTLGGARIVATWCPVAHSGVVYDRAVDGRPLELGAVGLDKGVFILYDRQTHTNWSQITGRALRGPLGGRSLRKRTSLTTTWGKWRRLQPGTTVYVDPALPGLRRFTEETIARMTLSGAGPIVKEDLVAGIEGPRGARAYLLRALAGPRVVNDTLDGDPIVLFLAEDGVTVRALRRELGGRVLTFSVEGDLLRDLQTGSSWHPLAGRAQTGPLAGRSLEPLVVTTALWYAWHSQRPDTTLWNEPPGTT
jgi:hypothetical protein